MLVPKIKEKEFNKVCKIAKRFSKDNKGKRDNVVKKFFAEMVIRSL